MGDERRFLSRRLIRRRPTTTALLERVRDLAIRHEESLRLALKHPARGAKPLPRIQGKGGRPGVKARVGRPPRLARDELAHGG
jgi:hypothetical protein